MPENAGNKLKMNQLQEYVKLVWVPEVIKRSLIICLEKTELEVEVMFAYGFYSGTLHVEIS